MKNYAMLGLVSGSLLWGCNGTETQNPASGKPLVAFGNSGCKKEVLASTSSKLSSFSPVDAGPTAYEAEVEGLKCVAWEMSGTDRVKINLINFEEACGAQWEGTAKLDDSGQLQLGLVNPQCLIALCGWCIYDWSFDVAGVRGFSHLPVTITIDTCPGQQELKTSSVDLPLDTQQSGIKCRYANFFALGWQAMSLGTCGAVGMPCEGTSMCSSLDASATKTCQSDLVCTNNGDTTQEICAKPCANDADCGSAGVLSCQSGLCRPKNLW